MSMKNSSDTIGNRTRDLPTCSAVPQPTAPPRAPKFFNIAGHKVKAWHCPVCATDYLQTKKQHFISIVLYIIYNYI